MGKLLEFRRRPELVTEGESKPSSEGLETHLNANQAADLLEFLTSLTKNDSRSFHAGNVDKRQKLIHDASPEQLYTWLNRSTRLDWQRSPSFYHAVIAELRNRELLGKNRTE